VLKKLDRYLDVQSVADVLNEKRIVILNLETCPADDSRRIIDFLSGVAYANSGISVVCRVIVNVFDILVDSVLVRIVNEVFYLVKDSHEFRRRSCGSARQNIGTPVCQSQRYDDSGAEF